MEASAPRPECPINHIACIVWGKQRGIRVHLLGLSFLALILLGGRLYEVDREVSFLDLVMNTWLPKPRSESSSSKPNTSPVALSAKAHRPVGHGPVTRTITIDPTRRLLHTTNLRIDLDYFVVELSTARTTLILSVVFVAIFILSWWWMAFAIKQARDDGTVSLRTVLLLAVFAAVDVAASAGFILLRIIMFQSSCGATDILVIVVIGFLTGLRVYSVVCVFSYYKKAKNGAIDSYQNHLLIGSELSLKSDKLKDNESYIPRPIIGNYSKRQNGGATFGSRERLSRERLSSLTPSGSTLEEELQEIKIQAADMATELQRAALYSAAQAVRLYSTEKHIAESIKQDFDHFYHPTWHCIVGRNWGSCVTHSKQCYIRMAYKDLTILLYKST
ncbi:uncharacterized protein LOC111642364 [Centruroides sculpturatus]|uniref:uncharacterized protein LOC111642364 n=1 Tax=Centruroides sculpturatus TaxID=218467 RepID=UPI000C6DAC2C|nr:uncharacterized protein LOC111642364 [Centruroides sculpturatus]